MPTWEGALMILRQTSLILENASFTLSAVHYYRKTDKSSQSGIPGMIDESRLSDVNLEQWS